MLDDLKNPDRYRLAFCWEQAAESNTRHLMEEYLTATELAVRIKFSRQTLYNLIYKGSFVLGKHYLKPTPKKLLFKWSEIQKWMGDSEDLDNIGAKAVSQEAAPNYEKDSAKKGHRGRINI